MSPIISTRSQRGRRPRIYRFFSGIPGLNWGLKRACRRRLDGELAPRGGSVLMSRYVAVIDDEARSSVRILRAVSLTIILFVAVYAPALALSASLHLQIAATVPFVMFLTLVTAGIAIRLLASRTPGGLVRYGFSLPALKHVGAAVIVGAPVAIFVALLLARVHEAGPLAGLSLAPWLAVPYFVVGAPIQEEVIFRGLLQTTLAIGAAPPTAPSP